MPEGPLGGPRPFARSQFDGKVVFTNPLAGGGRITVPEWARNSLDLAQGDEIEFIAFAMPNGRLDVDEVFSDTATLSSRNRINITSSDIRKFRLVDGDPLLVVIEEVS